MQPDRSASHNSIQLWPDSFERDQPKSQALISSLYLTRTCGCAVPATAEDPMASSNSSCPAKSPSKQPWLHLYAVENEQKLWSLQAHDYTPVIHINDWWNLPCSKWTAATAVGLFTLPRLLSVKHSLPHRVPTSQADQYSQRASSMFNMYTRSRTVSKFKVSECELMMVRWRIDRLKNKTCRPSSRKSWIRSTVYRQCMLMIVIHTLWYQNGCVKAAHRIIQSRPFKRHARSHKSSQLYLTSDRPYY